MLPAVDALVDSAAITTLLGAWRPAAGVELPAVVALHYADAGTVATPHLVSRHADDTTLAAIVARLPELLRPQARLQGIPAGPPSPAAIDGVRGMRLVLTPGATPLVRVDRSVECIAHRQGAVAVALPAGVAAPPPPPPSQVDAELLVSIGVRGNVRDVQVVRAVDGTAASRARQTLMGDRYVPATLDGIPVPSRMEVKIGVSRTITTRRVVR
jgi:hypothetical protein